MSTNDHPPLSPAQLVVVDVHDELNAALAGHEGAHYLSPPQPHPAALQLVTVLLGRPARGGETHWARPIAGGRRTITLVSAASHAAPTSHHTPTNGALP